MEKITLDLRKIVAVFPQTITDLVVYLDADFKVLFINSAAKKIYGKCEGCDFLIVHKKKAQSDKLLQGLKKQKSSIRESICLVKRKVVITWSIVFLKTQRSILLYGKNAAVKARDTSRENIELKNYISNIIDVIPGSLYWKNSKGVYLGCNNVMARESKMRSVQDIVGKTDYDLWPEHAKRIRANDIEVMNSGIDMILEECVKVKDQQMYFHSVKTQLRDAKGKVIGILGNSFDITERKKTEEKILLLEKEKAVVETRRQIIATMASSIAHEIGNLLAGTQVNLQLLSYDLKPALQRLIAETHDNNYIKMLESFELLERNMKNSNLMFESIKMNIRSGGIDKSQFELANIGDDLGAVLRDCFPGEEIVAQLTWNSEQKFDYLGIPAYTRNILINLIKNALYFIKEQGKGVIAITLKKGEQFNQLIFEDTAKGIAPEIFSKLFTRFSTTRKGGAGIGLAFCKTVMQEYGGDIICESEFGKYTRFILTFPTVIVE